MGSISTSKRTYKFRENPKRTNNILRNYKTRVGETKEQEKNNVRSIKMVNVENFKNCL